MIFGKSDDGAEDELNEHAGRVVLTPDDLFSVGRAIGRTTIVVGEETAKRQEDESPPPQPPTSSSTGS